MSDITIEIEGRIGWIVFNRPEKLNAFTAEMLEAYSEALESLEHDAEIHVIAVRGEGRAFSVGYDVAGPGYTGGKGRRRAIDDTEILRKKLDYWLQAFRCSKPVIAAVHGFCVGGATMLPVCCDLVVVAEDAVIGWPKVPLGGGMIGPANAWVIGQKKARELSYIVGSEMTGAEAYDWGWANYAVPADRVVATTLALAQRMAFTPLELLVIKKRAFNRTMEWQGFSESVLAGAEFDAIAHDSSSYEETKQEIRQQGLRATIRRFAGNREEGR